MSETPITVNPPRLAVIACAVLEKELALHAAGGANVVETRLFEIGLHDQPDKLRQTLQAEVGRMDQRDDIDAIVLVYGLCGRGTDGLRAGRHSLVIARAHDCVTHYLGSKERYAELQARHPDAYFFTPGWNRARRVPGPDREAWMRKELAERFDPEDVDFLVETERAAWAQHGRAIFMDLGTEDASQECSYAKGCADALHWKFQAEKGDPSLLRDLLRGVWDEARFQLVPPGGRLTYVCSPAIFKAEGQA